MSLIITKFGGSSLADANQFKKVKAIVEANPDRRYVVPSAPGKRFPDDVKVTDMLYQCYDLAAEGENFDELFEQIKARFNGIIKDLELDFDLSEEFMKMYYAFKSAAGSDYAASRGEYLNGLILAKYLGYDFCDASKCIRFHDNGTFDAEFTDQKTKEHLAHHERAVIPGFYGRRPNDTIKTFSRGGSDITGSLIAKAMNADLYENWTDVSGFLRADPRIIENPEPIDTITYRELRELSYMGATVLHEDAIFPVHQAGIPINIRNTNDPDAPGTMIVPSVDPNIASPNITGIAGKKGFSLISIEKAMMNAELGFGRRVLQVLEKHGVSFEHFPSGIDTMSIIVETKALENSRNEILRDIMDVCSPDHIEIEDQIALIAVVGRGMIKACGTAAKIFGAVAKANINIRMIDQGSSELNIILGVEEGSFENALRSIYDEFR
jgi:aspartate kinase